MLNTQSKMSLGITINANCDFDLGKNDPCHNTWSNIRFTPQYLEEHGQYVDPWFQQKHQDHSPKINHNIKAKKISKNPNLKDFDNKTNLQDILGKDNKKTILTQRERLDAKFKNPAAKAKLGIETYNKPKIPIKAPELNSLAPKDPLGKYIISNIANQNKQNTTKPNENLGQKLQENNNILREITQNTNNTNKWAKKAISNQNIKPK